MEHTLERQPLTGLEPLIEASHNTRWRRARFGRFVALLETVAAAKGSAPIKVLDMGGTADFWRGMEPLWGHLHLDVTITNLGSEACDEGIFHIRPGNACAMPDYADASFDVVHSNSVIEHVGSWADYAAMAGEVRRLAPHYFVQTPNLWFPYEPHYRTLFIHWLPEPWRAALVQNRRRGFFGPYPDFSAAMLDVQSINLLDAHGMKTLFPDGKLERERFFGFTKSLIMVK